MRRICLALLIGVLLMTCASALHAGPRALRWVDVLRPAVSDVTVPPEWDGVWAAEDSVYDCNDVLQSVESYLDTLCSGQLLTFGEDPTGTMTITCDGTTTATTADVVCSGSSEIIPNCTATLNMDVHATRTGDTYVGVSIMNVTYSGTAEGCDLVPATCQRTVSRATRLGPAPTDYCTTPTRNRSWGQVKIRYR